MADLYTFITSEQVSLFQPPNSSITVQQVTAQANPSGIIFLDRFTMDEYGEAPLVESDLNGLASGFNGFSQVTGVVGISTYVDTDTNGQLVDKTSVTVESSSGKSSTVIDSFYPTAEFESPVLANFQSVIEKVVAELDAVEAA